MVGKARSLVDAAGLRPPGEARAGDVVVEAPADVLRPGLAAVRPPGVLIGFGVQAAELCPKNAAATATGFIGTFAYLGAAVSGYPVGYVTQRWGWDGFFWFMAVCASLSVLLLIPLWSISKKSIENKKAVEYA